jgi:hypothetical protein
VTINLSELDDETLALMRAYAGSDFAKPRMTEVEVFCEYSSNEWGLSVFQEELAAAIAQIPPEWREAAKVRLEGDDYGQLRVYYEAPETVEVVNERIARCLAYARERQDGERAAYERLKKKFA